MGYLLKTVETIRVGSEEEAKRTIEDAKANRNYTLAKYSSEYKCQKSKGEIIDEWYRVTLTKQFTEEKEPDCVTEVTYKVYDGAFPYSPATKDEDDGEE